MAERETEWQTVRRGARPTKNVIVAHSRQITYKVQPRSRRERKDALAAIQNTFDKILRIKAYLQNKSWWQKVSLLLQQATANHPRYSLQCLGLGSFLTSDNARHQLACALLIRDLLPGVHYCSMSDPLMGDEDFKLCKRFGFDVVDSASDAVRPPADGECAVLFLPHCGIALNEKVLLECTRFGIDRVVLFANLLSNYIQENGMKGLVAKVIERCFEDYCVTEHPCPDAITSSNCLAFNDLAITTIKLSVDK